MFLNTKAGKGFKPLSVDKAAKWWVKIKFSSVASVAYIPRV